MKLTLSWKAHFIKQCKWAIWSWHWVEKLMSMEYANLTLSWKACANKLYEWSKLISHAKEFCHMKRVSFFIWKGFPCEFTMWKEWIFYAKWFTSQKKKFCYVKRKSFTCKMSHSCRNFVQCDLWGHIKDGDM